MVDNGLGGIAFSVLKGLDRNPSIERCSCKEVRIVRVPASLEGPVGNNGKFAVGLTSLGVPANVTVILARGYQKIRILVAPRKRENTRFMAFENLNGNENVRVLIAPWVEEFGEIGRFD